MLCALLVLLLCLRYLFSAALREQAVGVDVLC